MKIRITDLLDGYYDTSVKLDAPEAKAVPDGPNAVGEPNRFGMRQALSIAAALMLVVMSGFVLHLRMSGAPASGNALAEGEEASPTEPDVATEPTMGTAETSYDPMSIFDAEIMDATVTLLSSAQAGSTLSYSCAMAPVPEEFIGPSVQEDGGQEIFSLTGDLEACVGSDGYGKNSKVMDYVNQNVDGYDKETQTLYLSGTADLALWRDDYPGNPENTFGALLRLWNSDRSKVVLGWELNIDYDDWYETLEVSTVSSSYFSYVQRGNQLSFSYIIAGVPAEFVGPITVDEKTGSFQTALTLQALTGGDGYHRSEDAASMDCVDLQITAYDADAQKLYLYGSVSLEDYMALFPDSVVEDTTHQFNFITEIYNADRTSALICESPNPDGLLHLADFDCYAQGSNERDAPLFSDSPYYGIRRLEVTHQGVMFSVSPYFVMVPGEYSEAEAKELLSSTESLLDEAIESGVFTVETDENRFPLTGLICQKHGYTGDIYSGDWEYIWTDPTDGIDPLRIQHVDINKLSLAGSDGDDLPVSANCDADGDGILTAELGLNVYGGNEDGALVRLTVDLATGDYTWYADIPELYDMLTEDFGGDFDAAIRDEYFSSRHVGWGNAILEQHLNEAEIVFTDGSTMVLGDGNVPGYADGLFHTFSNLAPGAAGRTIDHLTIHGTQYVFE